MTLTSLIGVLAASVVFASASHALTPLTTSVSGVTKATAGFAGGKAE